MGEVVEGLGAALAEAHKAFNAEQAQVGARHETSAAHDQLRKLAPSGGYEGLPTVLKRFWRWHARNEPWFSKLPYAQQREHVLSITGPRGPDGLVALRAAGFVMLRHFEATGQRVTATKADGTRKDSRAVAFLIEHLPEFDKNLRAEAVIRNAAYTITKDYNRSPFRRK